ncbi:MAG: undecaprenyl-diphosphate phosphatase [Ignavibacteria bacterium]|nr:undecaprenyl-diphosphate phosphatase [Ignavibacteria bacterium]
MEDILKAVVLGIIQGITEFLPISSTAHLRVVPAFFGWKDIGAAYTAVIQIGTLIATIIYFRKDIIFLVDGFRNALKRRDVANNNESRILILIIVGTIPIGVCGLLFKRFIEGEARGLYVISAALILLAVLLFIAEKRGSKSKGIGQMTIKDGIIIGLAQALALIPGSSRSGVTITAGLFRGLKRDDAARFSFLLSLPAIFLSGVYELYKERHILLDESLAGLITATVVSGIVGYYSIEFLLNYLRTKSNMVFIVYRILLGVLILILLGTGFLTNLG